MIDIQELSFSYGDKRVLKSISLSISHGERWAIIGPNGVGKSTLIRCIAGLEKCYTGSIKVKNRDVNAYIPRNRAKIIAYVPQAQDFHLPYTAYEYVMMGRFPYQSFMAVASEEDKKCVNAAIELTDTNSFANRAMYTLSGGELQRVLLAGAVAQRTGILLLDEPATFLGPLHQELIRQALERIHNEYRCTILTVTHDVNTALFRYDKVLALVDGAAYYTGNVDKLIENYSSALKDIFGMLFIKIDCNDHGRSFVMPVKAEKRGDGI